MKKLGVAEFVNFSTREISSPTVAIFPNNLHQLYSGRGGGVGGGGGLGDLVVAFCKILFLL